MSTLLLGLFDEVSPFAILAGVAVIVIVGRIVLGNKRGNGGVPASAPPPAAAAASGAAGASDDDVVSEAVCGEGELDDGEMREVALGPGKVLLTRSNGVYSAIGTKCTHMSAPLVKGAFVEGRVRCPWHGACFNTTTGDIEDFPGLDSVHAFQTEVRQGQVWVTAPVEQLRAEWRRQPSLCTSSRADKRHFVCIGAGPASVTCIQALRANGFRGRITLVGKEDHLPYDRTKLSKSMTTKVDRMLLRPAEWYADAGVDLRLGEAVKRLDHGAKRIETDKGAVIHYDRVLVATGGDPRRIPVEGLDLPNVFQLRVVEEAHAIVERVQGQHLVIMGSSFIGMEAAACLYRKAESVTVIGMEKVPFERVLGAQVGAVLQRLHEDKGIVFEMERTVKQIVASDDGQGLSHLIMDNGKQLQADIVVCGCGVVPATSFIDAEACGVTIERDRSVAADAFLRAAPDMWVAGDIARYNFHWTGDSVRIEHWGMAHYQGRIAGLNMVADAEDAMTPATSIPYFWTSQFGKSIRYAGHALGWDELIVDGDLDAELSALSFVVFMCKAGKVHAVCSFNRDPVVSVAAELMTADRMPTPDVIRAEVKAGNLSLDGNL